MVIIFNLFLFSLILQGITSNNILSNFQNFKELTANCLPITAYMRDTQTFSFSIHNLGGVPHIYATVVGNFKDVLSYKFSNTLEDRKVF